MPAFSNIVGDDDEDYDEDYTVMKVQIGMFGDVKRWQKQIEKVSELFDTEDEESLHYILQGRSMSSWPAGPPAGCDRQCSLAWCTEAREVVPVRNL